MCPGSLLHAELYLPLRSRAWERSGQHPHALHLPQARPNHVCKCHKHHHPAGSCLHPAMLHHLISPLQLLPRLSPTVLHCLTSHSHTHTNKCARTNPNHAVSTAPTSPPTLSTRQGTRCPASSSIPAHHSSAASSVPLVPPPCPIPALSFSQQKPSSALLLPHQQQWLISQEVPRFCPNSEGSLWGSRDRGVAQAVSSLSNAKQGCSSSAHKPMHDGAQHIQSTPSARLRPHLRTPAGCGLEASCSLLHPSPSGLSHPCQGQGATARVQQVPAAPHHLLPTPTLQSHPPGCRPGPAWAGHGAGAVVPPGTRSRAPRSHPCWTRTRRRCPTHGI